MTSAPSASRPSPVRATFLVVANERATASTIAGLLQPYGQVTVVHALADAVAAVCSGYTGCVVDLGLLDGDGMDVVAAARSAGSRVRALLLAGVLRREDVNRADALDAALRCKPCDDARITAFGAEVEGTLRARDAAILEAVRASEADYGLTAAQAVMLRAGLRGVARADLAEFLRVAETTVKTHVHDLLAKTGDKDFDAAVMRLLRDAFDSAW